MLEVIVTGGNGYDVVGRVPSVGGTGPSVDATATVATAGGKQTGAGGKRGQQPPQVNAGKRQKTMSDFLSSKPGGPKVG